MLTLKQEEMVPEYRERFEFLSVPLRDVLEEMMMGAFMNGLKEEIWCDVKLMHPRNLKQRN